MKERILTIEIDYLENCIYIGEDGASGSKYTGSDTDAVAQAVKIYLEDNKY